MKYYTVRGHKNRKMTFESIGMIRNEAIELVKDIRKRRDTEFGFWAKNTRFTLKKI